MNLMVTSGNGILTEFDKKRMKPLRHIRLKKEPQVAKKQKKFYVVVINGNLNAKDKKMMEKIFFNLEIASFLNKYFINERLSMRFKEGKFFALSFKLPM